MLRRDYTWLRGLKTLLFVNLHLIYVQNMTSYNLIKLNNMMAAADAFVPA